MSANRLSAGDKLTVGQQIVSTNGKSHLLMQSDGNLVLYRNDTGRALWASGTDGRSVDHAIMQNDGNLVCYTSSGQACWASGTFGNPGAYAQLGDDGNLVVYSSAQASLWASNTVQWDFTPSTVAAHAIWPLTVTAAPGSVYFAAPRAPGWAYKLRRDGAAWADAPYGWARVPVSGSGGLPMRNDTVIHVASMSKPVCATAFVAMLEDWRELANGVAGKGPLAVPVSMTISVKGPFGVAIPQLVQVPRWLAPALSNPGAASQLMNAGLLNVVPPALRSNVVAINSNQATAQPVFPVPPGYVGLLGKVVSGTPVPQYTDKFLPLIRGKLQAKAASLGVSYAEGLHVSDVTIEQLVKHQSALRNGITDPSLATLIPSSVTVQPSDGSHATCDIWSYLLAHVRQNADGSTGYKNDDHNFLGGIVEACVGASYDDYVYERLLPGPRFGALRRYVTNPSGSAFYYNGLGSSLSSGNPFPDYRGWGGAGGFYYTADQITDWLYALYSGAPVQRVTLSGATEPLVSSAALNLLFGTTAYFSAGQRGTVASTWTTYTHNGGTGVGSGSCSGDMGIAVSTTGVVMTAFFCANGQAEANGPFDQALAEVIAHA
jgi:CubicO group peptidase (beta-lactamase class C family)